MNKQEFEAVDALADCVNEKINELHKNKSLEDVLEKLQECVSQLPDHYSLSVDIKVNIFDSKREKQMSLLHTGFNSYHSGEPYRHYGDSSIQKYYVEGNISVIPQNYCPHCWGEWDFKFKHTTCPECGYELGKQVKYLLDDDICPLCEKGTVSVHNPVCDKCGYEVDPQKVVWG